VSCPGRSDNNLESQEYEKEKKEKKIRLTGRHASSDYGLGDTKSVSSANLQANIVSVLQAGCFVGALAAFPLADYWGRKWCLVYASIFTLIGVIMQAAASGHLEPLYIGRFVAGKYLHKLFYL
jgi:MFS family permease